MLTDVKKIGFRMPLARGRCTHGRAVLCNLLVSVIIHEDDKSDCDGDVV